MKIPGVAEMVYANTNPAFSKMAVLSENLDKLEEIYDFIFKYKDYVDVLLDEYVRINHVALSDIDSLDNTKFKGLETTKLTVDGANYYGTITIGTIDNDSSVTGFKLSLYNNDDLMLGELKFGYDPIDERFYTLIPNTYEDVPESAVNVAYLHTYVKSITDKINASIGDINTSITSATTSIENLESRVSTLENQIVQKAEKSDLDELKAQVGGIKPGLDINSIKGIFWAPNQTYTTGKDRIWIEAEIGETYTGNELYTECVHDETTHTTTLSGQLNTGTYVCLNPSKITLSHTTSGTVYNGSTLTDDYYSHQEVRGVFAPVNI